MSAEGCLECRRVFRTSSNISDGAFVAKMSVCLEKRINRPNWLKIRVFKIYRQIELLIFFLNLVYIESLY